MKKLHIESILCDELTLSIIVKNLICLNVTIKFLLLFKCRRQTDFQNVFEIRVFDSDSLTLVSLSLVPISQSTLWSLSAAGTFGTFLLIYFTTM